ncbi:MAG: alpha-glucan family phosphorylase [Bacteroidales bacterium]|nr:alpha-glucan family phosphorylase [Bacteroidales bacterium]
MSEKKNSPDFLFETSWEVCNQIGGMHTVLSTKAPSMVDEFNDKYIVIGPDLVQDSGENPEFIPDNELYADWRRFAEADGFRLKVGRWSVPGKPVTILIDFSDFFSKKDEIFAQLWEDFRLDSISGQWEYIEPALFGYSVGKIIESFIRFNLSNSDRIVAQFHEWMSGAGILYLKKTLPQVATIFTAHATVLGRTLSSHYRPLYDELKEYDPVALARELKVVSKQSLEKLSAGEADVFATVSDLTAMECEQFLQKKVDIILPNGFEDSYIPEPEILLENRETARNKMLGVASLLVSQKLPADAFIVATSGRYEFKNKGIDLFIDTISKLREKDLNRTVVAFLFNPTNNYGARKDLQEALNSGTLVNEGSDMVTHYLHDAEMDPILRRIKERGITNLDPKVKLFYVPAYLNGLDGIFNLTYYDILQGCDQTVFTAYYEPWGYTPLESIAFGIPSVTTTHAGIGRWIKEECDANCKALSIIERKGLDDEQITGKILEAILNLMSAGKEEREKIKDKAIHLSKTALWSSLISYYHEAISMALDHVTSRAGDFVDLGEKPSEPEHEELVPTGNEPKWKRIIVRSKLPNELEKMNTIIHNIWWTWDDEAQELFETIDPELWRASDFNPSILLEQVPYKRLQVLSKDAAYIARLDNVYARFEQYMKGREELKSPKIAYFSMEFGFHDSLKLYSGGLGLLAGDYLKEASDAKVNIVGIGILYRFGYFTQMLTTEGEQQAVYDYQHFSKIPISPVRDEDGEFMTTQIVLPGRIMYARVWHLNIGRIEMYLLDTDFELNTPEDRVVSHRLYGGDEENRLKQELLLGVGGTRALDKLGIHPDIFHSNEGHSAFCGLERMRILMINEQLTFSEAKEIIRASTLFTTHTPVPAGHDHFEEDLLRKYLGHYPNRLQITWDQFMALGRANPNNWKEKFNMSYLASNLAQDVNGVSMLHGAVTRDMFTDLWPGFLPEELHIGYVTNGVHWPTWTSKEWKKIYQEMFDGNFVDNQSNFDLWKRIYDYDDKVIWDIKQRLRSRLIYAVKERFKENWIKRHEDPKQIVAINNTLSDKSLTVVFARRFATYKRAHLLFNNPERLAKLVNNPDMPVQFIFAGKAHPADKAGQELIKLITSYSKRPEFLGKILFLQNYSIGLAKLLVSGADIWMNTPTRPLEASGTSGEKAVMNGTLHFSVLDGWWVEGYQPDAGWALTNERTYENQNFQDNLDAEIIYSLLENEILPAFYNRNDQGYSSEWVGFIKNTIAGVSPRFTTRRMINDYTNLFYTKQYSRSQEMLANDYELAKRISSWKRRMVRFWNDIEVINVKMFEKNTDTIDTGTDYEGIVEVNLNGINPEHVGIELVVTENMKELINIHPFRLVKAEKGKAMFKVIMTNDRPGTFSYGIRMYAKHDLLPHRQDFALIKWI